MSGSEQNQAVNLNSKVKVLVGPTSSGKTGIALAYCKKHDAVIISADSRQIFKYMDIGTGKQPIDSKASITKKEGSWIIDGVEIFGYDLVHPDKYYSAYDFAFYARTKLTELVRQNRKVLLVGGTGFYIDLVTGRITLDSSSPDFELRNSLEEEPLEVLQQKLEQLSPDKFASIDRYNKARLVRAVENLLTTKTDKPLPDISRVDFKFYGLTASRGYLYSRVDKWVETVFEKGLVTETLHLVEMFPNNNYRLLGLVYKTALAFINKELSYEQAIQETKWDLHGYIRRQQTWFKKNPDITWLNVEDISPDQCIIKLDE